MARFHLPDGADRRPGPVRPGVLYDHRWALFDSLIDTFQYQYQSTNQVDDSIIVRYSDNSYFTAWLLDNTCLQKVETIIGAQLYDWASSHVSVRCKMQRVGFIAT